MKAPQLSEDLSRCESLEDLSSGMGAGLRWVHSACFGVHDLEVGGGEKITRKIVITWLHKSGLSDLSTKLTLLGIHDVFENVHPDCLWPPKKIPRVVIAWKQKHVSLHINTPVLSHRTSHGFPRVFWTTSVLDPNYYSRHLKQRVTWSRKPWSSGVFWSLAPISFLMANYFWKVLSILDLYVIIWKIWEHVLPEYICVYMLQLQHFDVYY